MKCELVFKNGKYLDVRNREFIEGNILISNGKIIGINKEYSCLEQNCIVYKKCLENDESK